MKTLKSMAVVLGLAVGVVAVAVAPVAEGVPSTAEPKADVAEAVLMSSGMPETRADYAKMVAAYSGANPPMIDGFAADVAARAPLPRCVGLGVMEPHCSSVEVERYYPCVPNGEGSCGGVPERPGDRERGIGGGQ